MITINNFSELIIPDHRVLLRKAEEILKSRLKDRQNEPQTPLEKLIPDCKTLGIPIKPSANPNPRWVDDLIPNYRTMIRRDVIRDREYTPTLEELEQYLHLKNQD